MSSTPDKRSPQPESLQQWTEFHEAFDRLCGHRNSPIPDLKCLRPDLPPDLVAIFERMVAKLPGDRYPSMQALRSDVEHCADQLDLTSNVLHGPALFNDPSLAETAVVTRNPTDGGRRLVEPGEIQRSNMPPTEPFSAEH